MTQKDFLTTGEAAKVLNVSRCTVSRKFDRGILAGKKHPITGERYISRRSLLSFMKQHQVVAESPELRKKRVLVGSTDRELVTKVRACFADDERVSVDRAEFGGDVLIRIAKEDTDLLVLDEDLPDISSVEVIRALRRSEEGKELRVICLSRSLGIEKYLEWGADEVLPKDSLDRGDLAWSLYSMLGLLGERVEESFEHQRQSSRTAVDLPARVELYRLGAPHVFDSGRAVVKDISEGGAWLSGLQLEKGMFPCEPFGLLLEIEHDLLRNWQAHCKVVRLRSGNEIEAGVQFISLSEADAERVKKILKTRESSFSQKH